MKKTSADWLRKTKNYAKANNRVAAWQLVSSIVIIGFLLCLSHVLAQTYGNWGWNILVSIFTGLFMIRIFGIQHDCGHGSFTTSQKINTRIGLALSMLTHIPFKPFKVDHAFHHAHNQKLDSNVGDVKTLTVSEYHELSHGKKLSYRLLRIAMVTGIGGCVYMLWYQRFHFGSMKRVASLGKATANSEFRKIKSARLNMVLTDVLLVFIYTLGVYLLGWSFFVTQMIIILVFSIFATWLFYVQHQFEDVYKSYAGENTEMDKWEYVEAALRGSSYYKLPPFLNYLSCDIGYHFIHHLNHKVPNYNLKQCYLAHQNHFDEEIVVLTLKTSLKSMFLHLYDQEKKKLISFQDYKKKYAIT